MQEHGVRVVPYINGRLFDVGTETWKEESSFNYASKRVNQVTINPGPDDLSLYQETYGSGATTVVMCPATNYMQKKMSSIVIELCSEKYGFDGVYIDQIGAAGPKPCYDETHGHPIGGG